MLIVSACASSLVLQSECLFAQTISPSHTARYPSELIQIFKDTLADALLSGEDKIDTIALSVLHSEQFAQRLKSAIEAAELGDVDVISNDLIEQLLRHNELVEREC